MVPQPQWVLCLKDARGRGCALTKSPRFSTRGDAASISESEAEMWSCVALPEPLEGSLVASGP